MSLLPEGRHEVEVLSTGLKKSENTGTVQIVIEFGNADGTIAAFLPITEKAWQYTEAKLQTLGWDPAEHGFRFEDLSEDPSPLVGVDCQIVVREEEYNGKMSPKVSFINPPGSTGGASTAHGEAAASIADEIRALLGVRKLGTSTSRARKADNSDVPF